jgi:Lon protease-like protein
MGMAQQRQTMSNCTMLVSEIRHDTWDHNHDLRSERKGSQEMELAGGLLVATYTLVEKGQLAFDNDIAYKTMSETEDDYEYLDTAVLEHIKESTRGDLDCHLCYELLFNPLTTACGHTFCRECLARNMDHSTSCPVCRRMLPGIASVSQEKSNKRLTEFLIALCPDQLAARAMQVSADKEGIMGELDTALFVCTLSFPAMPTFLHIFEPRYRLMIRRAIETGQNKFGMLMYNQSRQSQGDLGVTQFMEYGTLLHIQRNQVLPDGRSMVESIGVSRFKVKSHGSLDGYTIGKLERIDDISLAEEEHLEAMEISAGRSVSSNSSPSDIDSLPTRDLHRMGVEFIQRMKAMAAPWLHHSMLQVYGPPPEDPAIFPYWFASIVPLSESEKYRLLPTTSVRERLKITAKWIRALEAPW